MPKEPMKNRVVRVSDQVWDAAKRRADENSETISDAIRNLLERYCQATYPYDLAQRKEDRATLVRDYLDRYPMPITAAERQFAAQFGILPQTTDERLRKIAELQAQLVSRDVDQVHEAFRYLRDNYLPRVPQRCNLRVPVTTDQTEADARAHAETTLLDVVSKARRVPIGDISYDGTWDPPAEWSNQGGLVYHEYSVNTVPQGTPREQ